MQTSNIYKDVYLNKLRIFYKYRKLIVAKHIRTAEIKNLLLKKKKFDKEFLFDYKKEVKKVNKYLYLREKFLILHLNSSFSNFFFTLTNEKEEVVMSVSSGQVSKSRLKKVKISNTTINQMIVKIVNYLKNKGIFFLIVYIKMELTDKIANIFSQLKRMGIEVEYVFDLERIPHSLGMRKKKIRRL